MEAPNLLKYSLLASFIGWCIVMILNTYQTNHQVRFAEQQLQNNFPLIDKAKDEIDTYIIKEISRYIEHFRPLCNDMMRLDTVTTLIESHQNFELIDSLYYEIVSISDTSHLRNRYFFFNNQYPQSSLQNTILLSKAKLNAKILSYYILGQTGTSSSYYSRIRPMITPYTGNAICLSKPLKFKVMGFYNYDGLLYQYYKINQNKNSEIQNHIKYTFTPDSIGSYSVPIFSKFIYNNKRIQQTDTLLLDVVF